MTQAITVRRDGDIFQARLFWRRAARLLDLDCPIVRVGFESGPKSFDDIWVEYDPTRAPPGQAGEPLYREHIQCKWHVTPDTYGYAQLIDPEFVNANARSLLERARAAQLGHPRNGAGVRFKLLTNWHIDRNDPLRLIVGTRSSAVRLDRLFGTMTDVSKMGALRKAWREHLGIDDTELRLFARTLAFGAANGSLDDLRDDLDILFGYVGLRRVPANESAFFYDDLIFQWMAQGRLEFDRTSFRRACEREGLLGHGGGRPLVYGVKSFEHAIDRLEDRCADVLDLVPMFDERYIRSESDWEAKLYPALRTFLLDAAKGRDRLRIVLDAHASLAFAAGSVLNIKSGRAVEIEQRTTDRRVWSADDTAEVDAAWPKLDCSVEAVGERGKDLAVGVGFTHDVGPAVKAYLARAVPEVGTLLLCKPSTGPGARSVVGGRHAFALAESLTERIRAERAAAGGLVHLFVAAPNAFTFFLGQRQPAIGRVRLYEFDFDGARGGSYEPSLALPIAPKRETT